MTAARPRSTTDALPRSRRTSAFERRVARVLDAHVPAGGPLVVASSGGPDSTATLVAAVRTRGGPTGADVVAACFDHRMRPAAETRADRVFVRQLAGELGIAVRTGRAHDAGARSEADARVRRYRWLAGVCAQVGATAAATGHTLDDQAETVLLRLTRGAGLVGVAGMAEVAPWPVVVPGGGARGLLVVRPLLDVSRADVLEYLDALEVEPREDATNGVLAFDRNRVRHRVVAELRRINPRAAERIARFAASARRDEEALTGWARRELVACATREEAAVRLDRRAMIALPPAVAARVLRLAGHEVGVGLDAAQVDQLLAIAGRSGARATLAGGRAWTDAWWLRLEGVGARG